MESKGFPGVFRGSFVGKAMMFLSSIHEAGSKGRAMDVDD